MSYRELSDKVTAETEQNPKTPAPKPTEDYEYCKSCGTMMPLNGNCPLCGVSRLDVDKTMWDKFKRSE